MPSLPSSPHRAARSRSLPMAFAAACVLTAAALIWTTRAGGFSGESRSPLVLAATTEAAGSRDITIHIGIPPGQQGGVLSLVVMAVNRGPAAAENLLIAHRMPAGLRFSAEESDRRCLQQGDEVLCSLMGNGRGFALRSGQSASFTLSFLVEECATPSQHQSVVRRAGDGDLAQRTTNIAFSCDEMMKPRPVSSLPSVAPAGTKEGLPSVDSSGTKANWSSSFSLPPLPSFPSPSAPSSSPSRPAPPPSPSSPAPRQTLEPCLTFCPSAGDPSSCKILCTSISTAPIKGYLCNGNRVASFQCTVFPRTSRDGTYPRSSCEYDCE